MAKASASPNYEILEAALQGLEAQREKLDEQIAQVRAMMGRRAGRPSKNARTQSAGATNAERAGTGKRRVLSAEARKRIAAAQKKRWAAFRKDQS
jgi:peptidoglycan hydrolase CwlO-like protein